VHVSVIPAVSCKVIVPVTIPDGAVMVAPQSVLVDAIPDVALIVHVTVGKLLYQLFVPEVPLIT
jgi:hypothetical protein